MIIRALELNDLEQLKQIHAKFYANEFELPNFFNGFLGSFIIIDGDEIVTVSGVRPIAESIAVTNKDVSARKRREALFKVLEISSFICRNSGFDQLHAFINDSDWNRQLKRNGFNDCKGNALFLNV